MLALSLLCGKQVPANEAYAGAYGYAMGAFVRQQAEESCREIQMEHLVEENRFLLLVNKDHPLPEGYQVELQRVKYGSCEVDTEVAQALERMLADGQAQGLRFVVASGYRDYDYQMGLLEEDIQSLMRRGRSYEAAFEIATRETMPPGNSEHSTGLAVDLVSLSHQMLDEALEDTAEIQWLQAHCAEYGFILRYPRDKEEVTKISYESWHFRYVGEEAARKIQDEGITLEEYLEDQIRPAAEYFAQKGGFDRE